ncbi:MAG: AAA family ATPase [Pseudomonadota bacterium]|nr:AAA family ATPase [Pseudomonadota bacterium]
MIINSVRAENVLKYSTLDLADIPEKGLIAVIGDNESGKSSIGESICFALFGRTFSLEPRDLDKVIRWGESRCSIKLDFTTPNGQRYQVARFLDELGNHGASISRAGEEPVVRGVAEVEASLKDLIGFGYKEFIESFYLAQREITTPHPHSFAVKAMAGVDALEKIVSSCGREGTRARKQITETEKQKEDVESQIEALNVREGYLASLEADREAEDSALSEDRQQITALKDASDQGTGMIDAVRNAATSLPSSASDGSFNDRRSRAEGLDRLLSDLEPRYGSDERTGAPFGDLGAIAADLRERLDAFDALREMAALYKKRLVRSLGSASADDAPDDVSTFAARDLELHQRETDARSSRRTSRVLMVLFLVLALTAWGGVGLLSLAPDSAQAQTLGRWLAALSKDWETLLEPWFSFIGGVLSLLFVAFLVRGISLRSRLRANEHARQQLIEEEEAARQKDRILTGLDDMPLGEATAFLASLGDDQVALKARSFQSGPGADLLDPERHAAALKGFRQAAEKLEAGIARVKADAGREIERLHDSVTGHASGIARLDGTIEHERERVRRHGELIGIVRGLSSKIDELSYRVKVRGLAVDLLKGAIHYISQRFNTEVRNLSADSLPTFTNGRYEHLQIDENLKVKAFSNEKRDFMDLDEISSGTQRQIMLAVRMALSQKLVNSVIQGPQMLFLDEPFAFFDERRTASSLAVLPRVSGDFTQIWVTSQTFPAESHFDMYVECNAEETRSPVVRHSASEAAPNNARRTGHADTGARRRWKR